MRFETVKIADLISEISMGPFGSNIKVECFVEDGIPVLNGGNLDGFALKEESFRYVTEKKADSLGRANAHRGDVIITHRGTLGQIVFIPEDSLYDRYVISQSQFRVKCNEKILPEYLVYYFHTRVGQHKLLSNASQVGVPALARASTTFQTIEIEVPDVDCQRKIIDLLEIIRRKVEINNTINENLSQQADLIFDNLFGRHYKEPTIPLNWSLTELGNIDVFITDYVANGSFKSLAENVQYLDTETNNVLVRLTDYNNNYRSDMVYLSDASYEFLSKSKLFGDEIIISNVGANVGTVFRCPRLSKRMSLGPNAVLLRSEKYEHYLYLLFKSTYGQGLLQSIVTGSAQPKFNKTNFRALKLIVPDEKTLSVFNDIYTPMFERITANDKENTRLSQIRDTLLPKLLSGDLDVSNLDL